jgi:hypothetical protein
MHAANRGLFMYCMLELRAPFCSTNWFRNTFLMKPRKLQWESKLSHSQVKGPSFKDLTWK